MKKHTSHRPGKFKDCLVCMLMGKGTKESNELLAVLLRGGKK